MVGLTIGCASVSGCWLNPASGRAELALISESDEVRLGSELDEQVRQAVPTYTEGDWAELVEQAGSRLAAVSERSYLPWRFRVLDDPTPNAFALPGGYVYVTRGLLALLGSNDELDSVLAHEIGHVTARHSVNQLSKSHLANRGLGVFRILDPRGRGVGGFAAGAVQLRLLKHSRADELEADDLGTRYVAAVDGDPAAMIDVLETLRRIGEQAGHGSVPTHLSTHPDPQLRIDRQVRRLETSTPRGSWSGPPDPAYVRRLADMHYGADPRRGYVQAGRFVLPDANVMLQFPSDWHVDVSGGMAAGSDTKRTAMLLVGTSDQASASEAEDAFFSAEGFVREGDWVETIGGRPVRARRFSLRDGSASFPGWAVFAAWSGGVHLAIGLAEHGEGRAADDLRAALLTLAEPGPELTQVEPMRLRIVELDQPTTLRAFAQQQRSSVELDELVLLNRVEADVELAPGTVLRSVIGFNPARE